MSFIRATATSTFRFDATGRFISQRVTPAVVAGVTAYTQALFDETQAQVHVRSGELRDSGKQVIEVKDKSVVGHVVYSAPQAWFTEWGTGRRGAESEMAGPIVYSETWPGMPAQGWMRRSLDTTREAGFALFRGNVSSGLRF